MYLWSLDNKVPVECGSYLDADSVAALWIQTSEGV